MDSSWLARVQQALALDLPHVSRPVHAGVSSAVLILLRLNQEQVLEVLLTQRTQSVQTHRGQFAFPGGVMDEQDQESLILTALRETYEEMGISSQQVQVIGELAPVWTPSGFLISPIVGNLRDPYEIVANPNEIAEWFWVSLAQLRSPQVMSTESLSIQGKDYPLPVFNYDGRRIWGATAVMIKNLLDRLERVGYVFEP